MAISRCQSEKQPGSWQAAVSSATKEQERPSTPSSPPLSSPLAQPRNGRRAAGCRGVGRLKEHYQLPLAKSGRLRLRPQCQAPHTLGRLRRLPARRQGQQGRLSQPAADPDVGQLRRDAEHAIRSHDPKTKCKSTKTPHKTHTYCYSSCEKER